MTKIRNIDKLPVRLPLTKVGYRAEDKSSSIWASGVHTVIIRVNTDEGIQGLGELPPLKEVRNEVIDAKKIIGLPKIKNL